MLAGVCRFLAPWKKHATSRIWLAGPFARMLNAARFSLTLTDYCQWGECWRKRTAFAALCCDLSAVEKLCVRRQNHCSRAPTPAACRENPGWPLVDDGRRTLPPAPVPGLASLREKALRTIRATRPHRLTL